MAKKSWRLKFKGQRPSQEVAGIIGDCGGQVLRIHEEGGITQVYFAAKKSVAPRVVKAIKGATELEAIGGRQLKRIG